MPVQPKFVDFSISYPNGYELVPAGQRVTGLNTVEPVAGLRWGIRFGNNPIVYGYSGNVSFWFDGPQLDQDVFEGVYIYPMGVALNQGISFMVSF